MAGRPGSRMPPSPPLLRLPPPIRCRIYRFVGVASWDGRPSRFDLHGRQDCSDAPNPSNFHGLLLSCRTIYSEAAALLYSANWFVLYYSVDDDPDSVCPLAALTTPSLRSLSNLKIVVNEASCNQLSMYPGMCCLQGYNHIHGSCGRSRCQQWHRGLHRLPLLTPAPECSDGETLAAGQMLLRKWETAAARLSVVAPERLTLSLVCDIDPQHPRALQTAKSVVAPIRRLPRLRECHIRLAKTADARLQKLARDAVVDACGIPQPSSRPSSAATLASLPRELRIRILEYTDLITPLREVTWSRRDHAYSVFTCQYYPRNAPNKQHSAQFFHCSLGTSLNGGPPTHGCFCRRRHAAFSPACKCWAPPTALFLICRALYEDAQRVFFSSNRFIVHDFTPCPPWELPVLDGPYPNLQLAASHFLREVVPLRSLAHLRFLELLFPPYLPPSWPETHHPAMQDWRATIAWLRGKINPLALTLRLVVVDTGGGAPISYKRTITMAEGDATLKAYMDLLEPLVPLAAEDGLAWFYASLASPWRWTEDRLARPRDGSYWSGEDKAVVKERAERYVMGARYESLYTNGREEPPLGYWDDLFYEY